MQQTTNNILPIRKLTAEEIDIRVGQVSRGGSNRVSFLLYKNARVDMQILDELVGPLNWTREHKELKGIIYCGVGIRTEPDGQFVMKWDCGTESDTEREKGEASDSFKRACVNWGIGRELYTAPSVWITLTNDEFNNGKPRVDLSVSKIDYDKKTGAISSLEIVDSKGTVRFSWGQAKLAAQSADTGGVKGVETKTLVPGTANWKSLVASAKKKGYSKKDITDSIEKRGFFISKENLMRLYEETDAA